MTFPGLLLRSLVATSALVSSVAVFAQNDQVLQGPAPDWVEPSEPMDVPDAPRGLLFVRNQDTLVHFDNDGQTIYQGSRMKLLNAAALQAGNVGIAWNPAAGAPTVHRLAIHRNGQTIDVLEKADFTILRREDQLEAATIDGLLTATLQVPDLRIGDELELAYSVAATDPTLGNTDSGILFLADSPPPGRYKLALSWDDGFEPNIKLTPEFAKLARKDAGSLSIETDMPKTISSPKDAPPRYSWNRIAQYSDFEDWPAVSRRFDTLFTKASDIDGDSPVAREADRIAAEFATPMEQAAAALELVQSQVRYVLVALNEGNLTPMSAEETWERRYGDCKAKTALLMALLDRLGIDAEPVLVSTAGNDDGLDQRLPSPSLFDHVLVRATIDGKRYWMDGTLPSVAGPDVAPLLPYHWVLPLSSSGANIDRVQWRPKSQPSEFISYALDASAGFDEPAKITMTAINTGVQGLQEYMQFSAVTDQQLSEFYRSQWAGQGFFDTIDEVTWTFDEGAGASILTIEGTGPLEWEDKRDGKSLVLPGGGFSPPPKRQRDGSQDQSAPYVNKDEFQCMLTTVWLPDDTRSENWSFNSTFQTEMFGRRYARAFERTDDEMRMMRVFRTEMDEVGPALALLDNSRVDDFDNSKAIITWDPDKRTATRVGEPLPVASETAWQDSFEACKSAVS